MAEKANSKQQPKAAPAKVSPVLAEIEKIMKDFKGQPDFKIAMGTRLDGLGLDSLDTVSLIMDIEDKMGVTIEMNKETTVTVGDVVKIIEAQKNAKK